ncbi:MAG: hypothetical protein AAF570_25600, partial [Bacteroidota bacterium]
SPPGDALSLVNIFAPDLQPEAPQVGLVLDEWTEAIPLKRNNTGVALHYNQPDAKPPQSILLCLCPRIGGTWDYNTLIRVILSTFQMARMRAVDPDMVKESSYAQMLPATYAVHHGDESFPALDFARNIGREYRGVIGGVLSSFISPEYQQFLDQQSSNS